jgi:hypothetical protein
LDEFQLIAGIFCSVEPRQPTPQMFPVLINPQRQFFGMLLFQEAQFKRGNFGLYFRRHRVSILNQILRSIQRFPQCLKGVWIVGLAFFLHGRIPKSAHRETETFVCIIAETQGFPQTV